MSEKFFALCEVFGADNVGMLTGDAAVNPDAPIICCTAEILANIALREGRSADVGLVVMDEFHFYAEPDRGWAWQVPLLELAGRAVPADVGDPRRRLVLRRGPHASYGPRGRGRRGRRATRAAAPSPGRWSTSTRRSRSSSTTGQAPVYVVHFTQAAAVEHATSLLKEAAEVKVDKEAIADRIGAFRFGAGFGKTLSKLVRNGIGVHHAGMLPKYRRLVEQLAQSGLLTVICGTDTLGVGINVPIRTVLFTGLAKFDGNRQRVLRTREFQQIAGRAGRAGYDTAGYVVVQAPEHVIDNERAKAKAEAKNAAPGANAKRKSKAQLKKPPEGTVVWTEQTYDKLVRGRPGAADVPDAGRQRDAHQRGHPRGGRVRGDAPAAAPTTTRSGASSCASRGGRCGWPARLLRTGRADPARRARRARPPLRAHRRPAADFALNQPLAHFALAALDVLDPESESYTLDIVSVIESVLEAPAPDPDGPAVRRPGRGGAGDEGRRHRVRGADGAARPDHLAAAARRAARRALRDLPPAAPVAARGRTRAEVGRPGDVGAGDGRSPTSSAATSSPAPRAWCCATSPTPTAPCARPSRTRTAPPSSRTSSSGSARRSARPTPRCSTSGRR